jgi:hypothetical protein
VDDFGYIHAIQTPPIVSSFPFVSSRERGEECLSVNTIPLTVWAAEAAELDEDYYKPPQKAQPAQSGTKFRISFLAGKKGCIAAMLLQGRKEGSRFETGGFHRKESQHFPKIGIQGIRQTGCRFSAGLLPKYLYAVNLRAEYIWLAVVSCQCQGFLCDYRENLVHVTMGITSLGRYCRVCIFRDCRRGDA